MTSKRIAEVPSLYQVYKDYFPIGAAVNSTTLDTQKNILIQHYNSLTAENEMKFESIHPQSGMYSFEHADRLVAFAEQHGMKVRGHTLIWHNQTPDWMFKEQDGSFVNRETLLQRMKMHIDTLMNRYRGKVYCWDVVNEAIADEGPDLLRQSNWLDILGEDFISKAFEFAHLADPEAVLFYNDYNETFPEKRKKIYSLVKSLIARGVPIHGVGMQGHWNLKQPSLDEIRAAIEAYASLGLQIQITELDVSMFAWDDRRTDLLLPTSDMLHQQAELYERVFELFREYRDVISGVTFWGAADDYTWLHNFPVKGRKNWPFVLDEDHAPKPAFWKIVNHSLG